MTRSAMTARIFFKLILGVLCLLAVALVAVDVFVSRVAEKNYVEALTRDLGVQARVIALAMHDTSAIREFARVGGARITVIAPDGRPLADSEADSTHMENHAGRPEVAAALRGEMGSSIRHSATVGMNFLYVAVPVPRGALRVAMPLSDVNRQVSEVRAKILVSTTLAFLPAILLAAFMARYVSQRFAAIMDYATEIAGGNFHARLRQMGTGEFGKLGAKLNETGANLQRTVEQLQSEHAQLENLERVRKDFVINVSHELRTPLASISGYTETLLDGALEDPENNMRFLGIIRQNAERLTRLTEDLLTLSRIELKRQKFEFERCEVETLLRDAVQMMEPLARKQDLTLVQDPSPPGAEAWCDGEAVSQILSNLMDNAIKYTPPGGRVSVGARADGEFIELYVRDTGLGIPKEDQPRLFERFYRVDKARSRALGGTGLGLSIVKHLVGAHGGRIRVESEPQQGATFYFTLPVRNVNPSFTPA